MPVRCTQPCVPPVPLHTPHPTPLEPSPPASSVGGPEGFVLRIAGSPGGQGAGQEAAAASLCLRADSRHPCSAAAGPGRAVAVDRPAAAAAAAAAAAEQEE